MRRIRAEPVYRIKWIRRHDTFSSYRLRHKLHGPFSYATGARSATQQATPQATSWRIFVFVESVPCFVMFEFEPRTDCEVIRMDDPT